MRLTDLAESYIAERDNCEAYNEHIRRTVRSLEAFAGRELTSFDLGMVNSWLSEIADKRAKFTALGYRRQVIALWYHAADLGLCPEPRTRRIKRFKRPSTHPEAFSLAEIELLIAAAGRVPGEYDSGVRRADFWQAIIVGAYDLGFRRGDLLKLPKTIANGEAFIWQENKTGVAQCRQLSPYGCSLQQKLVSDWAAYPWYCNATSFTKAFNSIRRASGLKAGQFKWLRRSHGTYVGTLGHRDPRVFEDHYKDSSLVMRPNRPPRLMAPSEQERRPPKRDAG